MRWLAIAAICLLGTPAEAVILPKPAGVPQVTLASGKTIAVAVVNLSFIGAGLGILEQITDGRWDLCGQCLPSPKISLADDVALYPSKRAWIEAQIPAVNERLTQLYGSAPVDLYGELNAILSTGFTLNASPALVPK